MLHNQLAAIKMVRESFFCDIKFVGRKRKFVQKLLFDSKLHCISCANINYQRFDMKKCQLQAIPLVS